jgi:REP element-mobilizing transposase RayT
MGGSTYFVTFRVKEGTLSEEERSLVLEACRYWHQRKWKLYAAVVMPDHVHLLVQPLPCGEKQWHSLGEILHSVKSYTAHSINKHRRTSGAVWLDESFDRIVRDEAEFREKFHYMMENPGRAGLVKGYEEYPFWWHEGMGHRRDAGATPNKD